MMRSGHERALHCDAPSDMAVALMALEARSRFRGPGPARVPLDDFYFMPGATPRAKYADARRVITP